MDQLEQAFLRSFDSFESLLSGESKSNHAMFDSACTSDNFESMGHNNSTPIIKNENEYLIDNNKRFSSHVFSIDKNCLSRDLDPIESARLGVSEQKVDDDGNNSGRSVLLDAFDVLGVIHSNTSFGGCSRGSIKSHKSVRFADDYQLVSVNAYESCENDGFDEAKLNHRNEITHVDDSNEFGMLDVDGDYDLTWRLDPSISLSDWTIDVMVPQNGCMNNGINLADTLQHKIYPVHKSVIAVGPRRSKFLATEVRKHMKSVSEADAKETEVLTRWLENQRYLMKQQQDKKKESFWNNLSPNDVKGNLVALCELIGISDDEKDIESSDNKQVFNMFETTNFERVTRLQLHELQVAAFPHVLDYMYSNTEAFNFQTTLATGAYSLCLKLEIKSLEYKLIELIKSDMTMDNLLVYYSHSRLLFPVDAENVENLEINHLNKNFIVSTAEEICSQNLMNLNDDTILTLLATIDAPFMDNVVSMIVTEIYDRNLNKTKEFNICKEDLNTNGIRADIHRDLNLNNEAIEAFLQLSLLMAVYCNVHRRTLTSFWFWKLTDEKILPILEPKAAKALLESQAIIVGEKNSELSSLTQRCVSSLSEHWDDEVSTNLEIESSCQSRDIPTVEHTGQLRFLKDNSYAYYNKNDIVQLPNVSDAALELFGVLALRNAKRNIVRLKHESHMLRIRNERLQSRILNFERMIQHRQRLKSTEPPEV